MGKTALITGITGQDGGYLTELLLEQGYMVHGMIRPTSGVAGTRLGELMESPAGYGDRIDLHNAELTDSTSLALLMDKTDPDEVYHLAGQSHIQISFDLPEYTGETTALGTLRILEAIRRRGKEVRFYQAATSEVFGEPEEAPQTERTPFRPVEPVRCGQALRLLRRRRVPARLRPARLQRDPVQPREPVPRHELRDAQDRPGGGAHRRRPRRDCHPRQPRRAARLGLCRRLRARHVPHGVRGRPDDYVIATGVSHSVREFCERRLRARGPRLRSATFASTSASCAPWTSPRHGATRPRRARISAGSRLSRSTELVAMMVDAEVRRIELDAECRVVADVD